MRKKDREIEEAREKKVNENKNEKEKKRNPKYKNFVFRNVRGDEHESAQNELVCVFVCK